MKDLRVDKIRDREGNLVPFDSSNVERSIRRALKANRISGEELAASLTRQVAGILSERFLDSQPGIGDVQEAIVHVLKTEGYPAAAKTYRLFREQQKEIRQVKDMIGVQDDLNLTPNALKVLDRRYLLRDEAGNIAETPAQMLQRVAKAVASAEAKFDSEADVARFEDDFFRMMRDFHFLPNSPTLMNAGTSIGQLSACFVLPIEDDIDAIFESIKDAAIIHKSGGGTGFSFSRIRPRGDLVRSTMGVASGPVSFLRVFDLATGVMKQGGRRRGANMGILNADHPDIKEFVLAKQDESLLPNFNLSVGVSDEFVEAVSRKQVLPLINPRNGLEWGSINAEELMNLIVTNTWHTGEPGLIFLDALNRHNPTPNLGRLEATNPCGELPLLPYESCCLGSINLGRMTHDRTMDWDRFKKTIHLGVRFLDNLIEINNYPIPSIGEATRANRKIGLGVMGFADALVEMGIAYGSEAGLEMADRIMSFMLEEARRASTELATERGVFPNFLGSSYDIGSAPGMRNASLLAIAPTGTISILARCSSGIEPLFALVFSRKVMDGTTLIEINPRFQQTACERGFFSRDLMEEVARRGTVKDIDGIPEDVQRVFVTDFDIARDWHIRMQAVFQKYVDNAVAKTVNLPSDATPADIRHVYNLAHQLGCKGVTVYRYGSRAEQVLYLGGHITDTGETYPYVTAESEYGGGFLAGCCYA